MPATSTCSDVGNAVGVGGSGVDAGTADEGVAGGPGTTAVEAADVETAVDSRVSTIPHAQTCRKASTQIPQAPTLQGNGSAHLKLHLPMPPLNARSNSRELSVSA